MGSSPQHGARAPSTGPEPGWAQEKPLPCDGAAKAIGGDAVATSHGPTGTAPSCTETRRPGLCCFGVKKCKKDKYNGKGKISAGAAPTRAAAPAWKSPFPCLVPGMCPRAGSGQPGAAGRARAPVCPWAHSPAISLASVCVYIFIYIFIYIYVCLSHTALLIEEEQTAKQEVWMGEPV